MAQIDDLKSVYARYMIRLLRHGVVGHSLVLDSCGWADWADFVRTVRSRFPAVNEPEIIDIVMNCPKQRFRREGQRVAAWYGHSLAILEPDKAAQPPDVLYHGTKEQAWPSIQRRGLMPGKRLYVHLSKNIQDAEDVAKRRKGRTLILLVRAADAYRTGVLFYDKGRVFVTKNVPRQFITTITAP